MVSNVPYPVSKRRLADDHSLRTFIYLVLGLSVIFIKEFAFALIFLTTLPTPIRYFRIIALIDDLNRCLKQ